MEITTAEIRARVVGIITGIISLAVDRVMQDPAVQTALLAKAEASIKDTILLSLQEVPDAPQAGTPEA